MPSNWTLILALLAFAAAAPGLMWLQTTRRHPGKKVFVPIGLMLSGVIALLLALQLPMGSP